MSHSLSEARGDVGPAVWRDIVLKYFSLFFYRLSIGRGRSSGIRKSRLHLSTLLITIQPVLCIADKLRLPWGLKRKSDPQAAAAAAYEFKIGFLDGLRQMQVDFQELPLLAPLLRIAPFEPCSHLGEAPETRSFGWPPQQLIHLESLQKKKKKKELHALQIWSLPGLVYHFMQELHGVPLLSLPVDYNCQPRCLDSSLSISEKTLHYLFLKPLKKRDNSRDIF